MHRFALLCFCLKLFRFLFFYHVIVYECKYKVTIKCIWIMQLVNADGKFLAQIDWRRNSVSTEIYWKSKICCSKCISRLLVFCLLTKHCLVQLSMVSCYVLVGGFRFFFWCNSFVCTFAIFRHATIAIVLKTLYCALFNNWTNDANADVPFSLFLFSLSLCLFLCVYICKYAI